jgi:hypothetical protein
MTTEQLTAIPIPDAFRAQLMQLLADQILKYNGGKSSSIRTEEAESLLESILYCIRACLNTLDKPGGAMGKSSARELYGNGQQLVKDSVSRAEELFLEIKETRTDTDLIAYNYTLDHGIQSFFDTYDAEYAAHETVALIDYPLLCEIQSSGVFYIRDYLEELRRENIFCARYRKNYIRSLLFVHGRKHRLNYREMLVNIPELILEKENAPKPYHI